MTRPVMRAPVLVLDVRRPGDARTALESIQLDTSASLLSEHVVVVANVRELPELSVALGQLAKVQHLSGVILVAVGSLREESGESVLRVPSALQGLGVTLWVGQEVGVTWDGGPPRGLMARDNVTVDDLIAALKLPLVFERVHKVVSEVPHQVVSPAIDVEYATVPDSTLRLLRLRAMRHFVADGPGTGNRFDGPAAAAVASSCGAREETSPPPVMRGSTLEQAGASAIKTVRIASAAVKSTRRMRALFTRDANATKAVRSAVTAIERYRNICRDTAARIVASRGGDVAEKAELEARGLPPQSEPNTARLAEQLVEAIAQELKLGRPLRAVSEQLKNLSGGLTSSGGRAGMAEGVVEGMDPVLRSLRTVRTFSAWHRPFVPLLPLVFLSCLVTAGFGVAGGATVAVLWLLLLYRLLFAGPAVIASAKGLFAAGACVAFSGVLGGIGPDLFGVTLPTKGLGWPVSLAVASFLACLACYAVARVWRTVYRDWAASIALDRAGDAVARMADRLATLVRTQWMPAAGMTRYADSLLMVAVALDGLHKAFAEAVPAFGAGDPDPLGFASADTANDLNGLLCDDLVHLVRAVLRPAFVEIASNGPLSGNGLPFYKDAQRRLADYNGHLELHGIRVPPPDTPDDDTRRNVAAQLWRGQPNADKILLSGPRTPLPQLCGPNELRLLSPGEVAMVYFASLDIPDPPVNPAYDLIRTSGNAVGVFRLVPIRPGIVKPIIDDGEGR